MGSPLWTVRRRGESRPLVQTLTEQLAAMVAEEVSIEERDVTIEVLHDDEVTHVFTAGARAPVSVAP